MRKCLFVILLLLSTKLPFSFAETETELRSKVDSISLEIKQLEAEIASYSTKVTKTQGEAKTLKQAVAGLEEQKKVLEKQVTYTKLQLQKTEADISTTKVSIAVTSDDIKIQKDGIRELINSMAQKDGQEIQILALMGKNKTLSDSMHFAFQASILNKDLEEKTVILSNNKKDLEGAKVIYEKKNKELTNLQKALSSQKTVVIQTVEEKNTLLKETKNKETEYQKLIKEKQEKKLALEKEVNDFEAKLKVIIDASKIPKFGSGALAYPVQKVIITQYFGNTPFATANSQVYNGKGHNGIDFGIPKGTKILAAQDGTVLGTGNTDDACAGASYGKWILIKHSNGLSTLYAHLSSFLVSAGDKVSKGDIIALSGNTGYSTGPHLHFTVYASDAVHITGPTEYKSKACGTYIIMPVSPSGGYLNPLSFF